MGEAGINGDEAERDERAGKPDPEIGERKASASATPINAIGIQLSWKYRQAVSTSSPAHVPVCPAAAGMVAGRG